MADFSEDERVNSILKQNFARTVSDPESWVSIASQLIYAASKFEADIASLWQPILKPDKPGVTDFSAYEIDALHLQDTYLMLLGFAIENILKAGIVKKNATSFHESALSHARLPSELVNHNLTRLAELACSDLAPDDIRLLKKLETNLRWAGRYPVPLQPELVQSGTRLKNQISTSARFFNSSDISNTKQLVSRLLDNLGLKLNKRSGS
jgi:hypothetical protein